MQNLERAAVDTIWEECASYGQPRLLRSMPTGASFYEPARSMKAMAPTGLGQLLACCVPWLSNVGLGDVAELLRAESVGVAVESFTPEALAKGVSPLIVLACEADGST